MADKRNEPKVFKAFRQHGVTLHEGDHGQGAGTCPWCGKPKLFVNKENALWDCKTCQRSGNVEKFFEYRSEDYRKQLVGKVLRILRELRGISATTFKAFNVGWSPLGKFYSVPICGNPRGATTDIHRYYPQQKRSLGTSMGRLTFVAPQKQKEVETVYLMEGEWDAMAMHECLRREKREAMVYGVAGAGNLPKKLTEMFDGKKVIVVFDADRAGNLGAHRVQSFLRNVAHSVKFVHWPEDVSSGYDFRDAYLARGSKKVSLLSKIDKMLHDEPPTDRLMEDDLSVLEAQGHSDARTPAAQRTEKEKEELVGKRPQATARQTEDAFKQWLHMKSTEALDVMFGTVLANRMEGDPLWMFMVAPPGGSKTELLMSLSGAPLITACTSITPHTLISGANFAGGGDPSLLPKLDQRVLVVKDFTTIMSMNITARDEIFGQLRDAYDGHTEKQFGNGVVRCYESKFGIIAGVTTAIEQFSGNSVLGERFLKYRLPISTAVNAGRDAIRKALKNISSENTMRSDLQEAAKKVLEREVSKDDEPEMTDEIADRITSLAQWVARLRGVVMKDKYTRDVLSKPCAEIGTRLAKQLAKLAFGISMYKQDEIITDETYRTVASVACSTAPDRVEEIVKQMYVHDPDVPKSTTEIAQLTRFPSQTALYVLEDLALLRIVRRKGSERRGDWELTPTVVKLMRSLNLYSGQAAWKNALRKKGRRKRS